jgi:hypothetical protein
MGGLINTPGTGYLSWFYNSEFEDNWPFHTANAAAYNRRTAHWNVWNNVISTLYDSARQKYPLIPTPPSAYPNLVQRWQYFFQHPVLLQPNQDALLDYIHTALTTGGISGIMFGVRLGSTQKIETAALNGAVQIQMINIVVTEPMPTGRGRDGTPLGGGPPPIDLP